MEYDNCITAIVTELWCNQDVWTDHLNAMSQLRSMIRMLSRCCWWHEDRGELFRLYKRKDMVAMAGYLTQFYCEGNMGRYKAYNAVLSNLVKEGMEAPRLSETECKKDLQPEFLTIMHNAGFRTAFIPVSMRAPEEESEPEEEPVQDETQSSEDYDGDVCEGDK